MSDETETKADGGIVVDSHETGGEHGHGEVHDDHASFWPFLLSLASFILLIGLSGIRLGEDAILTEGLIFPVLAIGGAAFMLFTLAGFTYETFVATPQKLATRWPFDGVEKMKLGLWIFLGSDIVLFGAFIGSYIFIRVAEGWTNWHHFIPAEHVVLPGLINTYLLLASSFAVVLAMDAAEKRNRWGVVASLVTTFALAVGFLINKGIEWEHLMTISTEAFPKGWEFGTNVASSTFYVTTGLHGLHVTIGLLMLLWMIPRAWKGAYSESEHGDKPIEYFGLYWHFVDIVWLFLFPLFYIL